MIGRLYLMKGHQKGLESMSVAQFVDFKWTGRGEQQTTAYRTLFLVPLKISHHLMLKIQLKKWIPLFLLYFIFTYLFYCTFIFLQFLSPNYFEGQGVITGGVSVHRITG